MGEHPDPFGSQLIQRCVIVQRDERGYGLTVSGDNPVFIQSVKDNGAAYRAGVQQGDRIIKVNGTLVTQSNHVEVVKMIRSGPYVALTLLGRPPGSNGPPLPSPHTGTSPTNQTNSTTNVTTAGNRPKITNPQPADPEKGAEIRNERLNTYRNMLEQEKQLYDKTRTEYNIHPTEKLQKELNGIQTRIRVLEQQLQKAYREGAYPKSVIPMGNLPDNSDLLGDEQIADPARRKSDSKLPRLSQGSQHTRQRSTPETLGFFDDNFTSSAGLKRNNSDVQVKDGVRQKLRRGAESRKTDRRTPDLDALGRVRETIFSKSLGSAPDGSQQDIDMGDSSPNSTPPSQRRVPEGMEGLEDLMNPNAANPQLQMAGVGTLEETCPINTPQIHILSMEEDEFQAENENAPDSLLHNASMEQQHGNTTTYNFDDHGPFNNFSELQKKPAHMAVFLHYLISNSDPSSLFFYLVTDSYRTGSLREMKKWVYEIFSTFLAPSAPLRIQVQDVVVKSIENITNNQRENEEAMRSVFKSARGTALDEIKELLADFRTKRALGLGSIFGDQQLQTEDMEKNQELKIVEQTLIPHLERLTALEAEKEAKNVAMAAALTTFLKNVGVRVQGNALERCPSFTARDKRQFLPSKKLKTKHVKGHLFQECHFYNTAFCHHCNGLLWGIGNQGYQCQHCSITLHRTGDCFRDLQFQCPGKDKGWRRISLPKKDKNCDLTIHKIGTCLDNLDEPCHRGESKKSKKIPFTKKTKRPERTSGMNQPSDKPPKEDLLSPTSPPGPGSHIIGPNKSLDDDEEILALKGRGAVDNIIKGFEKDDETSRTSVFTDSGISGTESFDSADVVEGGEGKIRFKLGRSESLKSKGEKSSKRKGSERRSRSTNDEACLSRSLDDVDMDQHNVQTALDASNASSSSSLSGRSQDSPSASIDSLVIRPIEEYLIEDSDMEADADTPNWQDLVDKDIVKRLKPKEVKRQEVINELFYTEKSHVRTLKVLDRVFYQPMLRDQIMAKELILAVFPNLPELLDVHMALNNAMKKERRTSHVIQEIGDMLFKRFGGEGGETMKRVCATFCQNQKAALEMIKTKEKKDSRLEKFIADAESNQLCQRLPFRALISTGFQRLTKYPLLIENLLKYSHSKTEEYKKLEKVRDCCKDLLAHVNTAIKECENQQLLLEIAKKVDKGPLERSNNEIVKEFKNLDLTSRKLIHHSPLTWRLSKTKSIELHTLLLEDILVLLQKQDDKYILKCHSTTLPTSKEDQKNTHSPIILLNSVLCRPVATNKYAFFLVSTSVAGPQIYELVTPNKIDRETWMDRILKAQEQSKKRPSWRNDRRGARVATRAVINEEEEDKGDVSPSADAKAPSLPARPSDRPNNLAKTEVSKIQKPEELEAALADSIRAKLPEDMGTEDLMDFLVTMSGRITPLLKDVHEKRTCSKVEENIMKAVEIIEQRMIQLQSLVTHNEKERRDYEDKYRHVHTENDELKEENQRLQQELSASHHELLILQESMQRDQPMASADANSYESLPTTDIDRTPDEEPSADSATPKSNRLSYSGESSSTTDSEDNPTGDLDQDYSQPVGASAAAVGPTIEGEVQVEQPVRIVSNVVTELQPAKAHTAVELANDGLVSLHAATAGGLGLDKIHRIRPVSTEIYSAGDDDDELPPLGAPPPIPVEQEVEEGSRTPSVGEYRDSDMEEALDSIVPDEEKVTQETTQENVNDPSYQTPTVHSQVEQSESSPRHSPAIPLKDRGEGSSSEDASALRNDTEIATTVGGGLEEEKACHIEVVDCNDQSSIVSTPQPVRTQESEQTTLEPDSLISPTTTPDMQNQNIPATSTDTPTSGQDSSQSEPDQSSDITHPSKQSDDLQPQDDPQPQSDLQDDLIKFDDDLQLTEDALQPETKQLETIDEEKQVISTETESEKMEVDLLVGDPQQGQNDVDVHQGSNQDDPSPKSDHQGSNQDDPSPKADHEVSVGVEDQVEMESQSETVQESMSQFEKEELTPQTEIKQEDDSQGHDLQPQPDPNGQPSTQPEPELV